MSVPILMEVSNSTVATGLGILGAAGALWLFWQLSRRVVRWGFLIMYFLIGACVAWSLNPNAGMALPIGAGLAFSWTVMTIKRKIWKVITSVAVLAAVALVLPGFLDGVSTPKTAEKTPVSKKSPPELPRKGQKPSKNSPSEKPTRPKKQ